MKKSLNAKDDCYSTFNLLTMLDYDFIPETLEEKKITIPLKENIFKLLYGPITEFTLKPLEYIDSILNKNKYDFSRFCRTYANHSRIICIYSKRITKPFEIANGQLISEDFIYLGSFNGIIYSIESVMFKKLSLVKHSILKLNNNMNLKDLINLRLKENTDYLYNFSQYYYDYGSIREYTKYLLENCKEYLQADLVEEKIAKTEELISLKKEKYVSQFTALSPILTIAITLIFSLPTLKELLSLIGYSDLLIYVYTIINLLFILFIFYLYRERVNEHLNSIIQSVTSFLNGIKSFLVGKISYLSKILNILRIKIVHFKYRDKIFVLFKNVINVITIILKFIKGK